jgi:hypothetical protein
MNLNQINKKIEKSILLKITSYISIFLFGISAYFRTKTLKPWSDEIVSLVSNLNFYYNNFNFIGPFETQYFVSYSPKLTAGPLSSVGAIVSWFFSENIYVLRFSNLIYLIFLSLGLTIVVFKTLKIELNLNLLILSSLIIFSLTNTSWWYSILYLLPETICAVILINSILLFSNNRKLAIFLMSLSVFFGDFLTILMFAGFYLGTIYYEKSFLKIARDIPFALIPLVLWISLVLTFSEYSLVQYFAEYQKHYFEHPSSGEINLSISSIINNFTGSEVTNWGIADFLRVMIAPILFIYIVYSTEEMPMLHKLGKLQIILPLMTIYLWFWLLSPAKSIIYSGLFTTFVLIFNSYFLLFGKFTNKFSFVTSFIIYSFFLSSIYLIGLYLFLLIFILIYNNSRIGKVTLLFFLVTLMSLNQLNVVNEVRQLQTYEISIKSCKNSLETRDCLDVYFGRKMSSSNF